MQKKRFYPILIVVILIAGLLAIKIGLATTLTAGSSPVESPAARVTQLANLTLSLEEGENAVTAEQAEDLLFLWKGMRSLSESGTAADAEIAALASQIEGEMTEAQLAGLAQVETGLGASSSLPAAAGSMEQGTAPVDMGGGMPGGDMGGAMMTAGLSGQVFAGSTVSQTLVEEVIEVLESKLV